MDRVNSDLRPAAIRVPLGGLVLSNRIDETFASRKRDQAGALLPYLTAGYPDMRTTAELLRRLDNLQVAAVELGFPFSDPIADGPVIQTSFTRALERGLRVNDIFETVREVRSELSIPLLAMVSFSIVYRIGVRSFADRLAEAGFDGLITPDLAFEEAEEIASIVHRAGLRHVMMVAPTSGPQRGERIAALSSGFVYYQAVVGITGERPRLPEDLPEKVKHLRTASGCPIAVGFGVGTAQQVRDVCAVADGAIVGSAIVRRIHAGVDAGKPSADIVEEVASFVGALQGGTR